MICGYGGLSQSPKAKPVEKSITAAKSRCPKTVLPFLNGIYEPLPIFDAQIWNEEETGLLEELLRRHGRLDDAIIAPPFMHDQPHYKTPPRAEDPQISAQSEQGSGRLEKLLPCHGQLDDPITAPPFMHDDQPRSHVVSRLKTRHGRLDDPITAPPFMHHESDYQPRAHAEDPQISTRSPQESGLLEERLSCYGRLQAPLPMQPQEPETSHHRDGRLLGRHGRLEDSTTVAALGNPPSRLPLLPQEPMALKSHSRDFLERAVAELFEEQQRQQQEQQQVAQESWIARALSTPAAQNKVAAGFGGMTTINRDAVASASLMQQQEQKQQMQQQQVAEESWIVRRASGSRGITTTINRDAAASASLVQQQQQVATTSWVAQAELAGLALPPDLIRESARAARLLRGLQGMELEENVILDERMLREGGLVQERMMQKGGMQEPSFEVPRECTWQEKAWQEGQGSASMPQHASAGELTGPGSLNSPENASLSASPTTPPAAAGTVVAADGAAAVSAASDAAVSAAAAAAAAYPPTSFFTPRSCASLPLLLSLPLSLPSSSTHPPLLHSLPSLLVQYCTFGLIGIRCLYQM
ncbi:unnamed protein product [Closterium sp. Naga37s-1]|nr:unnamed protein product [Closterium sp. Naga37s-1]